MKDKYVNNADKVSSRIFGRDGIINKSYMEKMDKRGPVVEVGNQRLRALLDLGMATAPCIITKRM